MSTLPEQASEAKHHYAIYGRVTGLQIGCQWAHSQEEAEREVWSGELGATLNLMNQYECPVCLGDGSVSTPAIATEGAGPFCKDGGTCHHHCDAGKCFRQDGCAPLSASGLGSNWRLIATEEEAARKVENELLDDDDNRTSHMRVDSDSGNSNSTDYFEKDVACPKSHVEKEAMQVLDEDERRALAYIRTFPGFAQAKDEEIKREFSQWLLFRSERNAAVRELLAYKSASPQPPMRENNKIQN